MKLVLSLERAASTGMASTSPGGLIEGRLSIGVISNSLWHSVNVAPNPTLFLPVVKRSRSPVRLTLWPRSRWAC
jgi:hypothetical protein